MKPDEIHWNDWMRIIFGEVPPIFYVELFVRAALVYLLLLVSMRLLGKRMAGQLSRLDMAAMVALASSIGVSMLSPINGLLPPVIVASIIVAITRLLSFLSVSRGKIEVAIQGKLDTLVANGVLQISTMQKVRVTRERLFAHLRSSQVEHLGKVDRLYLEADGEFSILLNNEAKPGLSVLPEWDTEFKQFATREADKVVCVKCGADTPTKREADTKKDVCNNCGSTKWVKAVLSNE
jgi:uncharacterized membrane protein YcaP (DUF421 family)